MLSFLLNNKSLSLDEGSTIRIQWINPACFMDSITSNIGVGISIPANDHNRAILGNIERFEKYSIGNDRKFSGFEVRFKGVLLLSGTLNINKTNSEQYQGWLQSELSVMGDAQREKFLTDLDWKKEQTFIDKVHDPGYNDEIDDYNIKSIRNRGFWDGKGKEVTVEIPYINRNGLPDEKEDTGSAMMVEHYKNFEYMVNSLNSEGVITTGEGCVVSPYLHLRYMIKEALRMTGWYIGRNDMVGEGGLTYNFSFWNNLMVYNNFNIIGMDWDTLLVSKLVWNNYLRMFLPAPFNEATFLNWGLRTFNYSDLVPKIAMKDFLLGIQNTLNMIFFFDRYHKVHIIDRNEILNQEPIDLDKYKLGFWEIGERKQVTLKFLPEYDKEDTLFGSEFEDLTDRRSDFKDSVDTYETLLAMENPEFGDLRLVKNINKIYEYKFHVITIEDANRVEEQIDSLGWEFVSSGPQPFLFGDFDTIEEIKSPLSTLQKVPGTNIYEAVQKGNMSNMRNLWSDFSFRLLDFNDWLHPNVLYWEGETGLFERRWKKWARFWATRLPVEGEFDLPLNVLISLVHNITNPCRESKGAFIIEEMETEFGLNMIGKTKIKGYKL